MSTYLLVHIEMIDLEKFRAYQEAVPALIKKHGGRYAVRGAPSETWEGPEETRRIVVLEFPDTAAARAFWNDPDYAPVKALRDGACEMTDTMVEGV
jgi:uncharacterized protein (DUF1330 family)